MTRRPSIGSPVAIAVAIACACAACSRSEAPGASGKSVDASPDGAPRAAGSGVDASAPRGPVLWTGTYESRAGTLYVPDGGEWKGVKFRGDPSETGLGKGALHLEIDPRGAMTGSIDGPLGPALVSGVARDGSLAGHVYRKDATDRGFTGTLSGELSGAHASGTMSLSQADARVIREASFTLERT
jgi:hypothetical protein